MREEYHREAFAEDKLLAEDRSENYRGTVRVGLRRLAFAPEYSRQIDRKNVERLKKIFSRPGGCLRLSPPNCIPAVIDQQDLDLAIQSTGTTLEALLGGSEKEPPMLKLAPDYLLQCLHGQHRILAALEVLEPRDEWWTVHLYLSGLFHRILKRKSFNHLYLSFESRCENRVERGLHKFVEFRRRRDLPKSAILSGQRKTVS